MVTFCQFLAKVEGENNVVVIEVQYPVFNVFKNDRPMCFHEM